MNGYDQISALYTRPRRIAVAEAGGDKRSDGESSQTKDGANRYDTSTPEGRRKAMAAARRSDNPADEAKVRKEINHEANSTIDALMLGLNMDGKPKRDNRATRRGGYRLSPGLSVEAKGDLPPWLRDDKDSGGGEGNDSGERKSRSGGKSSRGRARQSEADITLSVCDDDGHHGGMGGDWGPEGYEEKTVLNPRRRMAESPLNPQIPPRDAVNWNGAEAELTTKKRNKLPKGDFALPGGRYPINDEEHARNALARVSQNGSPEEIAKVRAAVRRKFPDIDVSGGKEKASK